MQSSVRFISSKIYYTKYWFTNFSKISATADTLLINREEFPWARSWKRHQMLLNFLIWFFSEKLPQKSSKNIFRKPLIAAANAWTELTLDGHMVCKTSSQHSIYEPLKLCVKLVKIYFTFTRQVCCTVQLLTITVL